MSANRRRFLRSIAAAPFLPGALALPGSARSLEAETGAAPAASSGEAATESVADALTDIVKRRYGAHLTEADLEETRKAIAAGLEAAEKLRVVKLGNADEPVTVFSPLSREPGPRSGERR